MVDFSDNTGRGDVFALRVPSDDRIGTVLSAALGALRVQAQSLELQARLITSTLAHRYADQVAGTDFEVSTLPAGALDAVAGAIARIVESDHGTIPPTDGTFTLTNADGSVEPVEYPLTWAGLVNVLNEQTPDQRLDFKPGPNGAYATLEAQAAALDLANAFEQAFGTPVGRA